MEKRWLPLFVFFILSTCVGLAQTYTDSTEKKLSLNSPKGSSTSNNNVDIKDQKQKAFSIEDEYAFEKPTIGLGVGLFSYKGDIDNKNLQSVFVSRIASELYLSQRLNSYLLVNFNVLFGKLGANERFTENNRNLNFESEIRAGGLSLIYDFGNFSSIKNHSVSPFISFGIEGFEFLSKTDLYDANGNKYYYWSDGTIRDIDENASNAVNASIINRDYSYESDLRTTNVKQNGKYSEFSFAFPVGGGFIFKINENLNFRLSSTLHFSLTDYLDGVNGSGNDRFLMTSCSMSYNFKTIYRSEVDNDIINVEGVDFYAIETSDLDIDGVADMQDLCQGTPKGVPVDSLGCPLDDDYDGIPNYKDKELNTPKGLIVDNRGVQLNDSIIEAMSEIYPIPYMNTYYTYGELNSEKKFMEANISNEYTIDLGTYSDGLPADKLVPFLSIHDMNSVQVSATETKYLAGKFKTEIDARKRLKELHDQGFKDAKIVYKEDGEYREVEYNKFMASLENKNDIKDKEEPKDSLSPSNENTTEPSTSGIVYRVQLGAYSRALPKSMFTGVENIEIRTEDGLYKYVSKSFNSFEEASKFKVDMILKGYEGTFITAYKNGQRVTLQSTGATPANPKRGIEEISETAKFSVINKNLLVFKIQVGLFSGQPTPEKMNEMNKIPNLKQEITVSGLKRYVTGNFSTYSAAEKYRYEIIEKYNSKDVFVIAQYNGEYISVQEAIGLLEE